MGSKKLYQIGSTLMHTLSQCAPALTESLGFWTTQPHPPFRQLPLVAASIFASIFCISISYYYRLRLPFLSIIVFVVAVEWNFGDVAFLHFPALFNSSRLILFALRFRVKISICRLFYWLLWIQPQPFIFGCSGSSAQRPLQMGIRMEAGSCRRCRFFRRCTQENGGATFGWWWWWWRWWHGGVEFVTCLNFGNSSNL